MQQVDQPVTDLLPADHQDRALAGLQAKDADKLARPISWANGHDHELLACLQSCAGQTVPRYDFEGTVCKVIGMDGLLGARQGVARHLLDMGFAPGNLQGESVWFVPKQVKLETVVRPAQMAQDLSEDVEI